MSFVKGSNSAFSSSSFFFSSSSSISRPSLVVDFSFFPSNSFNCCTAYSSIGSTMYNTSIPFFLRELLQLLHCILVNRIHHIQHLDSLLPQRLQERRRGDCCNALAGNVIDVVLTLLHPINILLEADLLVTRLRTVITHEFCNLCSVRGILMHTQLQALAELLVKLLVIILLLSNLRKHLQALLD